MELTRPEGCVSTLLDRVVHDAEGRRLGRVREVESVVDVNGQPVVTALVVGPRGLLRRMRNSRVPARRIPWGAVSEMDERRIVVHGTGG